MTKDRTIATLPGSDGALIAFCVHWAAPDAPVIALVHSLGMDNRFWSPVADRLAGRATVIAIDARGHGRSGREGTPYTAEQMARDLLDVLDHLKVPSAIVGGASMGGCVALQFAGSYPDRTAGLALIDTTAWYGATAHQDWEERAMKASASGLSSLVEFQKTRWFSDSFRANEPQLVQECVDIFLANDINAYVASCRMLGAFDGRSLLDAVRAPTLVLVGDEDYAAPVSMARAMHDGIANSRMEIIPGARHLTPLEVPDRVARGLFELCSKVQA